MRFTTATSSCIRSLASSEFVVEFVLYQFDVEQA